MTMWMVMATATTVMSGLAAVGEGGRGRGRSWQVGWFGWDGLKGNCVSQDGIRKMEFARAPHCTASILYPIFSYADFTTMNPLLAHQPSPHQRFLNMLPNIRHETVTFILEVQLLLLFQFVELLDRPRSLASWRTIPESFPATLVITVCRK